MKTRRWTYVLAAIGLIRFGSQAQESSPPDLGYTPQPLGPSQTFWSKTSVQTNEQGEVTHFTNSFIQVGNGLNLWQSNHWARAIPELIATNGGVLARGAQATAFFSSNLNSQAATRIRLPSGEWLKLHLLGLAYHDMASGTNLLLAAPKNCAPQIVGTNRVAYVDALDDLRCDLVFSFTPAGVRQDLILRERPDAPEAYGLSNASTHLLLISEIDEGPAPQITERAIPAGAEILRDQTLDFGTMQMVPGRAFRLERTERHHDIFVSKQYETIGTRHFIVERIRYGRARPELMSLPLTGGLVTNTPGSTFTNGGIQRATRWYAHDNPPRLNSGQTAAVPGSSKTLASLREMKGFIWDWDLVTSESDVTFGCGTTYEVSGEVHLLGNTVLTPGAILKFDDGASLYIDGWLTCPDWDDSCWDTPALLTSVFDNAEDAGEVIQNSHGPVSGSYGPALCVNPAFVDSAFSHCLVRYADPGIISNNRSLVTVTVTDPNATKGSVNDTASFKVTRIDGDWSGSLYVSLHLGGTARLGIDYTLVFYPNLEGDGPGTVVLPPGMDSAIVCVVPSGTGNSLAYASTATVTIDDATGSPYLVAPPSSATVAIIDPTLPAPPMLLNIDFVTQDYSLASHKSGPAATGQSVVDFWNALSCPGQYSATLANLKTALFEATSVNLLVNNTPGTWGLGSPDLMYDLYMYPSYGQNGTLTLTGLTPGKYDLYLYGYDGNYSVSVGGTSYASHQNRDWPLMNPLVWTEGNQYSRFGNISVGSGQSLVITLRPGADGFAVVSGMQLLFIPDPPLVVTPPASQTVMEGSTATFTVGASGFAPLSYQWTLNGAEIAGATASSYTTEGVDMSANGRVYAVRVTNPGGAVTSAGANLTVVQCDPAAHALSVDAWKTSCEDKFNLNVGNLTGGKLSGGQFDLFAYFDGVNRTYVRTLQPWVPSDVLENGQSRLFTFCSVDRTIMDVDCQVVFRGGGTCGASPKFRIATRDTMALVMENTTLVPTAEAECAHSTSPADHPYARPICDPPALDCACNGWFPVLPAIANGGSPQLDNFYKPSDPPQYVDVSCPKQGFKNVYAMKQWHGIWGPRSDMPGSAHSSMSGNCICQTFNGPINTVDDTKYLQKHASAVFTNHYIYNNGDNPSGGSVMRDCSIAPLSGKATYAATNSGDVAGVAGASKAIRDVRLVDLPGIYCAKAADYSKELLGLPSPTGPVDILPTFTDGPAPAMEWSYSWLYTDGEGEDTITYKGHSTGFVRVDLAGGTYSCSYDYYWESSTETGGLTWTAESEGETINAGAASVTSSRTWSRKSSQIIENTWGDEGATITYLQPYTASQLNTDIDALLATWNLLDDVEYPWRNDGGTTSGPLVTYNERLASASGPSIKFDLENIGDDSDPVWGPPPVDTSLPPWPSQAEGAILGAPLPVHGPGVLYTNKPYFNFYHLNYLFQDTGVGDPEAFIVSYGAYSPFANATQWTDADQARIFPAGPFWAYGCGNHFGFWLKNPYNTDTVGGWEQGGYWGLVKCKWAESIGSHGPPGTDFVFKDWKFNFRDFIESYRWNSTVWYRNNIDTGCGGLAFTTPVRFTPINIPFPKPGAGYSIAPTNGSWWLSEMHSTPVHYDFDCCRPAIYVQPNVGTNTPDCGNGLLRPMPPAVCDERYGSLWMGRVDQSSLDACNKYVENRNDGTANPASCDPQIYLGLPLHSPGAYEIVYFPLPLGYGGEPPPPLTVRIDIARKNGDIVPDDQKHSNGSVVQIVPQTNPGSLYPAGIFLNIPTLSIDPPSALQRVHLKLKKIAVSTSPAKIRVYRRMPGQWQFAIFLDELTDERLVGPADLGSDWRLDSTSGGVIDLALIAESLDGTELARDTVRISSTPADPAPGRIVFVNPSSSSPAPPYDNFTLNAAHTITDAVAIMQPDDNVLVASGNSYVESGITLSAGGVVAGLAGSWRAPNPSHDSHPLSDSFDFSTLPVLNNTSATLQPVFRTGAPLVGTGLTFAGLLFFECQASSLLSSGGGAIHLENLGMPARIACCRFATNSAAFFGGAIYFSVVTDGAITTSEFEGNQVQRVEVENNQYTNCMGGAVACLDSTIRIDDCSFTRNSARLLGSVFPLQRPPLGSAGGGGDLYIKTSELHLTKCRLGSSVAGFPLAKADPPSGSTYFDGDGGSVLVHCPDPGAVIEITDSLFDGPQSYGNGGAICISYDSSPLGRAYFTPDPEMGFYPIFSGGICSGTISGVIFSNCFGGWQGGAISANGRGVQLTVENSTFVGCQAGTTHSRDGKGGALSVAGGIQWTNSPTGNVTVDLCYATNCTATGNGGALYNTIRGQLQVTGGTLVEHCQALNSAGPGWAEVEGLGGAIHSSAGGWLLISGGVILRANDAFSSGGGISVKSAHAELQDVSIITNRALGLETSGLGNGGGLYVTTCAYEAMGIAALVFRDDGTVLYPNPGILIERNWANRFGGGAYIGIFDNGITQAGCVRRAGAQVDLSMAVVRSNLVSAVVIDSGFAVSPSQIATENLLVPCRQFNPALGVNLTLLQGEFPLRDVGIYQTNSVTLTGAPWCPTLTRCILSQ